MSAGRIPTTANSPLTTKGDLFTYSTSPARLAVGANGEQIVADSSTATGLRYQTGNGLAQGAINGGFDIWQRGTSFTANVYGADRWYCAGGTTTYSQESTAANLPTGFRYGIKMTMSGTDVPIIRQSLETANAIYFAGKRVVLSYYASSSASSQVQILLRSSNSADVAVTGTYTTLSAVSGYSSTASTTTSMSRVYCVFDVPSTAQSLQIQINSLNNLVSGNVLTVTGVQLEVGSIPTEFRRAGGTIQGELAACQRYYQIVHSFTGNASTTTQIHAPLNFVMPMRTSPSVAGSAALYVSDGTNDFQQSSTNVAFVNGNRVTSQNCQLVMTNFTGMTQWRSYMQVSTAGGDIQLSAEL